MLNYYLRPFWLTSSQLLSVSGTIAHVLTWGAIKHGDLLKALLFRVTSQKHNQAFLFLTVLGIIWPLFTVFQFYQGIQGDQGDKGLDGTHGAPGLPGEPGRDGFTGLKGEKVQE